MLDAIAYRRAEVSEILNLRHQILREGFSISEVMFAEDEGDRSRHYGAFTNDGENICCLSLLPSQWECQPAWRRRAMATEPNYQGQGIGSELLRTAIASLESDEEIKPIWCHARVNAIGFYKRFSWRVTSKPFEYGNAGPSVTMLRD